MITFVDQDPVRLVRVRQTSTGTDIPILLITTLSHIQYRTEPGHGLQLKNRKKCSALHSAECFDTSSRQEENTKINKNLEKDIRDGAEDTQEEDSTHDEYDQDSSISVDDYEDSTASQEDDSEDWIECMKSSTKEADEKMRTYNIANRVATLEELKWRQALRIATQNPDRWTGKAADWNPELIISTKTQRRAAKRWEDVRER